MTKLDLMFPREVTNMWTTPTATWIKWIELQTLASTTPTSSILLVCSFNSFFIFVSPHLCHLDVQPDCEEGELANRHRTAMDAPERFWFSATTRALFCQNHKSTKYSLYRPATTAMTATRTPARIQAKTAPAHPGWPETSKSDASTCKWVGGRWRCWWWWWCWVCR